DGSPRRAFRLLLSRAHPPLPPSKKMPKPAENAAAKRPGNCSIRVVLPAAIRCFPSLGPCLRRGKEKYKMLGFVVRGPLGSGAQGLLLGRIETDMKTQKTAVKVDSRSVFEVDKSRLGIGVFSRPLLDSEARKFRQAWEKDPMPGFQQFEIDRKRIS